LTDKILITKDYSQSSRAVQEKCQQGQRTDFGEYQNHLCSK